MPYPLISVLVAFYDNTKHIEEAIRSAVDQTYPNVEIVVVDDCSPNPEASALIQSLQKKYHFKLIRKERNEGASRAFQTAFENSSGELISILSHDDIYTADKLKTLFDAIERDGYDAIYANGAAFTEDPETATKFDSSDVTDALRKGQSGVAELISSTDHVGSLLTQGALFSRRLMTELSWMRERFILDDWPFTIKVWKDYRAGFLDKVVYLYRLHPENIHKNYWRWFPARIQTVAELVDPEKKSDVLSFIFISMAGTLRNDGKRDDAYRFATAGLALSTSTKNTDAALTLLSRLHPTVNKQEQASTASKFAQLTTGTSPFGRAKRVLLRILFNLIPVRRYRKSLKRKYRIS